MTTIYDTFGPNLMHSALASSTEFICGTEYEIEDIKKCVFHGEGISISNLHDKDPYWSGDIGSMRDGSLRNNGAEFITKPVSYDRALVLFDEIHQGLTLGPEPYTARTSIHVHVNVASMNSAQVKLLLHTYALLEPVFFHLAGAQRCHNIHCVPLTYTLMPTLYKDTLALIIERWSKYTALNLCPIRTQGTIEFRHMHGTGDKDLYRLWLTLLHELWTFAFTHPSMQLITWLKSGVSTKDICKLVLPSSSNMFLDQLDFTSNRIDVKLGYL